MAFKTAETEDSLRSVEASTNNKPIRQCRTINPCACRYDDGSVVDLHPLARNDGTATYVNISDGSGTDFFFWNPCSSFSLSDPACRDVAVCMVRRINGKEKFYDIGGRQENANFNVDNKGSLTLVYTQTEISLVCSKSDYLTAEGKQSGIYLLSLASRYACPAIHDYTDTNTTHYSTSASMGGPTWIILTGRRRDENIV